MNNYIESCKILGLREIIDESQLKIAYRQIIKRCHPDRYIADKKEYERAIEQTKQVNIAYDYLSKLIKRNLIPQSADLHKKNTAKKSWQRNYTPGLPDDSVMEIPLESSHTVSVGYDYESYIMFIKFANSKVYKFSGISPTIFEEFLTAKSHHKYAHQNIFFKFPYTACNM